MVGCDVKQPELYSGNPAVTGDPEPVVVSPAVEPVAPTHETAQSADGSPVVIQHGEELVAADVGVGKKGRYESTGGPADFITTPVASLFAAKEMVAFRIQIPHALTLYKAANDNRPPATFDAFKQDILIPNAIALPELPEGAEYIYDPGESEVEKMFKVKRPGK
ncbi:MAG TPA: hypothetical protein DEB39_00875 [Planctomycetaceae bacterium]|nr:hypothetical protein [Planctomycetaceae bacterium]